MRRGVGVKVWSIDDSFPDLTSTMITPGEFRMIRSLNSKAIGDDSVEKIADFIHNELPDSFDEEIHISTFPAGVDKSIRLGYTDLHTISIGVSDQRVQERFMVQDITRSHIVDEYGTSHFDIFENPTPSYVNLVTIRSESGAANARQIGWILENTPDLLPKVLVLGPVSIDDV